NASSFISNTLSGGRAITPSSIYNRGSSTCRRSDDLIQPVVRT
ncbi:MAG: hypothetical protein ACI8Y6_002719, partial [Brevundimonas sp.]